MTALHVGLLILYSFLLPTFRSPDEASHIDMVFEVQRRGSWPAYDEAHMDEAVVRADALVRRQLPLSVSEAPPRGERPAFEDLGAFRPIRPPNLIAAHPPLFYYLQAGVATVVGNLLHPTGPWPYDLTVWTMRLLSIGLSALLPILGYAATRGLGASEPVSVAGAGFVLAIPQLAHITSSVNNDVLLTTLGAALTVALIAVTRHAWSSRPVAVLVGCLHGLALLTKGFALAFFPWVLFAYAVAWLRSRHRLALINAGIAVGLAAAVGGWWWIRNAVVHGALQPVVIPWPPAGPEFQPDLLSWFARYRTHLDDRFWGAFAYLRPVLPGLAINASNGLVAVGLLAAFARRQPERFGRLVLGMILFPTVAIAAVVAYGSYSIYTVTGHPPGVQGRYLFPGAVGLGALVAVGFAAIARRLSAVLPTLMLIWIVAMHVAAVTVILPSVWDPGDRGLAGYLAAVVAWGPLANPVTATLLVAVLVALCWTTFEVVRFALPVGGWSDEGPRSDRGPRRATCR